MKRFRLLLAVFALLLSGLACRAAQRLVSGPPTITPTPTLTLTPTITLTPTVGPSATPSPTVTRTPVAQQPVLPPCGPQDLDCIYGCFDRLALVLPDEPMPPLTGSYADTKANFELVRYEIKDDQLTNPDPMWVPKDFIPYQQNVFAHERIWKYFSYLIPAPNREMLTHYLVSMRGGNYHYIAYVTARDDQAKTWEMNVNLQDASDAVELTQTLIHEYGHLLTLNAAQMDAEELNCQSFLSSEGCARKNSYMDAFYQAYWKSLAAEWAKVVSESDQDTYEEQRHAFFKKYENHFVSEYAATNPAEDMAESWTSFVLFTDSYYPTIARQKVSFFAKYPELVQLRQQILDNLCSYQP